MQELLQPKEVAFSKVFNINSFSSKNYATVDIQNKRKTPLKDFLHKGNPYIKGEEPGSFGYVNFSNVSFIRNSCVNSYDFSNIHLKEIFLNPKLGYENAIVDGDILLCKDANIGDSCYFLSSGNKAYLFSSGIVKLNFHSEEIKYYVLAFLRDDYFRTQLDILTPRGSTIRHAGINFLKCLIPKIEDKIEPLIEYFEVLIKNIANSEKACYQKLQTAYSIIDRTLLVHQVEYKNPSYCLLIDKVRIDGGIYSKIVQKVDFNVRNYDGGYNNIYDYGFTIKRGPNLQKRDLGRSLKSDLFKPSFHKLIYPSDISDNGYLTRQSYIGARNPVWYLDCGDVLFSAEGTVGKTFIICNSGLRFMTNIHGIILSPQKDVHLSKSIFLGLYLSYLRNIDYMQKLSVGGQGGSFAVGYWDKLFIPDFKEDLLNEISDIYHNNTPLSPWIYNENALLSAGIFELNNFRMKCKEILELMVSDIKQGTTKDYRFYMDYFA